MPDNREIIFTAEDNDLSPPGNLPSGNLPPGQMSIDLFLPYLFAF